MNKKTKRYEEILDEIRELKAERDELKKENKMLSATRDAARDECKRYYEANQGLQKMCEELKCNFEKLHCEYISLKEEPEHSVCPGGIDVMDLENRHQQDCIRMNDLTVAVTVLAGLLTRTRKTMGMD